MSLLWFQVYNLLKNVWTSQKKFAAKLKFPDRTQQLQNDLFVTLQPTHVSKFQNFWLKFNP